KLADTRTLVDDQTTHGHRFSRLRLRPRRQKQPRLRSQKQRQPKLQPLQGDRPQRKLQMTTTTTMTMTLNVLPEMESLLIEIVGNSGSASTRCHTRSPVVDQLSGTSESRPVF